MGNYDTQDRLLRLRALDRMKALSDQYVEGKKNKDLTAMKKAAFERETLKRKFLKVVK